MSLLCSRTRLALSTRLQALLAVETWAWSICMPELSGLNSPELVPQDSLHHLDECKSSHSTPNEWTLVHQQSESLFACKLTPVWVTFTERPKERKWSHYKCCSMDGVIPVKLRIALVFTNNDHYCGPLINTDFTHQDNTVSWTVPSQQSQSLN